jgi:hypothetical protein
MSISANGSQSGSGILWATMAWGPDSLLAPGVLRAFDASNLAIELWNSNQLSARDGGFMWSKWCPPTIANGKVYVATYSNVLNVYGQLNYKPITGPSIGIHFGGETMAANETAGVIPQQFWNSAPAKSVGTMTTLNDSSGNPVTMTLAWHADGLLTISSPDLPGNFRMMHGYLDNSQTNPTTVTVTGVPAAYVASGYDVYVYADGSTLVPRAASYTLGATTIDLSNSGPSVFDGIFIPTTYTYSNYVMFPNQKGSSFTVTATPGTAYDNHERAPVNAIQIVAHR